MPKKLPDDTSATKPVDILAEACREYEHESEKPRANMDLPEDIGDFVMGGEQIPPESRR